MPSEIEIAHKIARRLVKEELFGRQILNTDIMREVAIGATEVLRGGLPLSNRSRTPTRVADEDAIRQIDLGLGDAVVSARLAPHAAAGLAVEVAGRGGVDGGGDVEPRQHGRALLLEVGDLGLPCVLGALCARVRVEGQAGLVAEYHDAVAARAAVSFGF